MKKLIFLFGLSISIFSSCDTDSNQTKRNTQKKSFELISPKYNAISKLGEDIQFVVNGNQQLDSLAIYHHGKHIQTVTNRTSLELKPENVGELEYKIIAYFGNKKEILFSKIKVLSIKTPVQYQYKLINSFSHNPENYTQGYEFHKGKLYESTGQHGDSKVAITNYKDGMSLKEQALDQTYFGEGISILNNQIYQLSWKAQKGFVYDAESLSKKGEFSYSSEGWGLCNDGKNLIMSDGTQFIRYIDPINFNVTKTIQVANQNQFVKELNELEYVNGTIWANVYGYTFLVQFDAITGEVIGILELADLMKEIKSIETIDVLNGIAYNKDSDTYFVTGKWWPKAFEIKIINPEANPL